MLLHPTCPPRARHVLNPDLHQSNNRIYSRANQLLPRSLQNQSLTTKVTWGYSTVAAVVAIEPIKNRILCIRPIVYFIWDVLPSPIQSTCWRDFWTANQDRGGTRTEVRGEKWEKSSYPVICRSMDFNFRSMDFNFRSMKKSSEKYGFFFTTPRSMTGSSRSMDFYSISNSISGLLPVLA